MIKRLFCLNWTSSVSSRRWMVTWFEKAKSLGRWRGWQSAKIRIEKFTTRALGQPWIWSKADGDIRILILFRGKKSRRDSDMQRLSRLGQIINHGLVGSLIYRLTKLGHSCNLIIRRSNTSRWILRSPDSISNRSCTEQSINHMIRS